MRDYFLDAFRPVHSWQGGGTGGGGYMYVLNGTGDMTSLRTTGDRRHPPPFPDLAHLACGSLRVGLWRETGCTRSDRWLLATGLCLCCEPVEARPPKSGDGATTPAGPYPPLPPSDSSVSGHLACWQASSKPAARAPGQGRPSCTHLDRTPPRIPARTRRIKPVLARLLPRTRTRALMSSGGPGS
ncbi:hypothetical protein CALCODRAFT_152486 [Calocera cornea HHB12733]|uniref:Uncharacterized protein n=1 Tax=Calocera cornea HHB12733 TaxID=1353952 RepID=A0A165CN57_9BASI|nr:hypothetical protein CALCODRAFT_152486 [Calocera cornea HHB12733]